MSQAPPVANTAELRRRIERLPRVPLAHLPTPLEELPRFSDAVGGPRVFIKRDDCTGLSMGGNKTRHNEFIAGHARELGADTFVWGAGVQSNNCRQTAAMCAKLGLRCHLVLGRGCHDEEIQGNLLLDHLCGATVQIVDETIGPELDAKIAEVAAELQKQGCNTYCWDREIVKPRAAISYLLCLCEVVEQTAALGVEPSALYVCSAGSTGVGLLLAKALLGVDYPVRNIAPIRWPWDGPEDLANIAKATAEMLEDPLRIDPEQINYSEDFVGEDYGIPTPEGMEALALLARTEGILLDPVYTAKAMAGLIADARSGRLAKDEPVVFVHTGGTPALFAYRGAFDDL